MFAEVSSLFVVNVVNAINVNVVNVDSFCQIHPLKTGGFMCCVLTQQKPDKIQMKSITKIKTSTKNPEFK